MVIKFVKAKVTADRNYAKVNIIAAATTLRRYRL
jgi:hypothetical protein